VQGIDGFVDRNGAKQMEQAKPGIGQFLTHQKKKKENLENKESGETLYAQRCTTICYLGS